MKNKFFYLAAAAAIIVFAGCSSDDHNSMMTNPNESVFSVRPADGTTGIRLDAAVSFTFSRGVDRNVAERNIRLIAEKDMADSTCPLNMMMWHGDMETAMRDSGMMRHLDDSHSTHGYFEWSDESTECVFRPDSMMYPGMRYMIHVGSEMVRMMGDRMGPMGTMGTMGTMGGHGSGMMSDHMMYHFVTMDTTDSGSGHEDHH